MVLYVSVYCMFTAFVANKLHHNPIDRRHSNSTVSTTLCCLTHQKFDHMTPTLRDDLRWLPAPQRFVYKFCELAYKCLHQSAPQYLQELCTPVTASAGRCHLRCLGDQQEPDHSGLVASPRVLSQTLYRSLDFQVF